MILKALLASSYCPRGILSLFAATIACIYTNDLDHQWILARGLNAAAKKGNFPCVRMLLETCADPLVSIEGINAYEALLAHNDLENAEFILNMIECFADLKNVATPLLSTPISCEKKSVNKQWLNLITVLYKYPQHRPYLSLLLNNLSINNGDLLLHCATLSGQADVVQNLLEFNGNPLLCNAHGYTAPMLAAEACSHGSCIQKTYETIVEKFCRASAEAAAHAFISAIRCGNSELATKIFTYAPDISKTIFDNFGVQDAIVTSGDHKWRTTLKLKPIEREPLQKRADRILQQIKYGSLEGAYSLLLNSNANQPSQTIFDKSQDLYPLPHLIALIESDYNSNGILFQGIFEKLLDSFFSYLATQADKNILLAGSALITALLNNNRALLLDCVLEKNPTFFLKNIPALLTQALAHGNLECIDTILRHLGKQDHITINSQVNHSLPLSHNELITPLKIACLTPRLNHYVPHLIELGSEPTGYDQGQIRCFHDMIQQCETLSCDEKKAALEELNSSLKKHPINVRTNHCSAKLRAYCQDCWNVYFIPDNAASTEELLELAVNTYFLFFACDAPQHSTVASFLHKHACNPLPWEVICKHISLIQKENKCPLKQEHDINRFLDLILIRSTIMIPDSAGNNPLHHVMSHITKAAKWEITYCHKILALRLLELIYENKALYETLLTRQNDAEFYPLLPITRAMALETIPPASTDSNDFGKVHEILEMLKERNPGAYAHLREKATLMIFAHTKFE